MGGDVSAYGMASMGTTVISDGEGNEVRVDAREAGALLTVFGHFESATVSACPECEAKVVAAVALVDVVDAAPAHPASPALIELADEAPTLHMYIVDLDAKCLHARWRDPGYQEWCDALGIKARVRRRTS